MNKLILLIFILASFMNKFAFSSSEYNNHLSPTSEIGLISILDYNNDKYLYTIINLQWLSYFAKRIKNSDFKNEEFADKNNQQKIKDVVNVFIDVAQNLLELSENDVALLKKYNQDMTSFSKQERSNIGYDFINIALKTEEADNIFAISHELFHVILFLLNKNLINTEKWDYDLHYDWNEKHGSHNDFKHEILADIFALGMVSIFKKEELGKVIKNISKLGCNHILYSHREYF